MVLFRPDGTDPVQWDGALVGLFVGINILGIVGQVMDSGVDCDLDRGMSRGLTHSPLITTSRHPGRP
jgi:hypothetical protein